jgi:hypothetical protein
MKLEMCPSCARGQAHGISQQDTTIPPTNSTNSKEKKLLENHKGPATDDILMCWSNRCGRKCKLGC